MKKFVLISCVSQKLDSPAPASQLYTSTLFRYNLAFAKMQQPDGIFVLSALYGLVGIDQIIEPYDATLNTMRSRDIQLWAKKVLRQLEVVSDLQGDMFVLLAGDKYRRDLVPYLAHYEIPLEGMRIGEQLHFLKEQVSE